MFLRRRQKVGLGEEGPRMPCSSASACAAADITGPAGTRGAPEPVQEDRCTINIHIQDTCKYMYSTCRL